MNGKASRRVLARTIAVKLLSESDRRSHWIKSLAAYLMEHGMDEDADLIMNDIAHELYLQGGHLIVEVTSARSLQENIREELQHLLKTMVPVTSAQAISSSSEYR